MSCVILDREAASCGGQYKLFAAAVHSLTHSVIHKHSTAGSQYWATPQLPGAELMIVTWAVGAELLCCIMCCVLCCVVFVVLCCVVMCCVVFKNFCRLLQDTAGGQEGCCSAAVAAEEEETTVTNKHVLIAV